jgi:hypothetical protein
VEARDVEFQVGDAANAARIRVGAERGRHALPAIVAPPGRTELAWRLSARPATVAGDPRPLGLCVYGFTLELRE